MEITLTYLKSAFNKYNEMYFENKLKTPKFKIDNTRRRLGCCHYNSNNIIQPCTISISKFYNRTQKQYDTTIIHEMIHQYIRQFNLADLGDHHGRTFQAMAKKINKDGWEIYTHTPVCNIGDANNSNIEYNVLYVKLDNRYFEFVVSKPNVNWMKLYCKKTYGGCKHIISTDVKYAHYRQCRTRISGCYVSKDVYDNV